MPERSLKTLLSLLFACAILFGQNSAGDIRPGGKNLGHKWRVRDWIGRDNQFTGTWTRRGDSSSFEMEYVRASDHKTFFGVMTLLSVEGATVTLRFEETKVIYRGTIGPDGRTIRGKSETCQIKTFCGFEAVADWQVAERKTLVSKGKADTAILGAVWKVHDYTSEGFDYHGTWTIDPKLGLITFDYKNSIDGKAANGVLKFATSHGNEVRILNPGRKKLYHGFIQPDGKTIKGTAEWCVKGRKCGWDAFIVK
ncbi:MAG: hypothetical protein HY858_06920 [Candidatus Solibacter usitatus]|nr:hypothetical protein [Candidatus Solibacter usitatus]